MSVKKIVYLSLVAGLCCFSLWYGCGRKDAVHTVEKARAQKIREFCDKYLPREIPSESERSSLAEIYETVARAYRNGQVSVIRQCETLISNRVMNLDFHVYNSLSEGVISLLDRNFFNLRKIEDFPTPQTLSDYLDVNLALVRFLGMAAAERLGLENPVDWWEGMSLRNLGEYKKMAKMLGKREYEKIVDEALTRWIDMIESEQGLTRIKLRRNLPAMLVRARMVGDVSPVQVIKGIRAYALNLSKCGYTPKWLDVEFPSPTQDETIKK